MKKLALTALILCGIHQVNGQIGLDLANYKFIAEPKITPAENTLYENNSAFCIYFGRALDYHINAEQKFELWEMFHYSFKVYKKDFLDAVNLFPLPVSDKNELVNCGGRLIKTNGTVEVLGKGDVLQEDDDDDTTYLLKFPYAAQGDIVEFFYVVKRNSISEDGYWTFPAPNVPIREFEATIVSPDWLGFSMVGYNGLPAALDTVVNNVRYNWIDARNLPAIKNETMAFVLNYLPKVEYTFVHNYNAGNRRFNTLDEISANLYKMYNLIDKKDAKIVKKINSSIKINKKASKLEQAKQIENWVKTNYNLISVNAPALRDFDFMQKNRLMNDVGCAMLLYKLFKINDIEAELVFTTDKTNRKFDKKSNTGNFLYEILLYFPDFNEYTSPYVNSRIGLPSYFTSGCDGVIFKKIKNKNIADFNYSFINIPLADAEKSKNIEYVSVKLLPDDNLITADLTLTLSGYCTNMLQANLAASTPDEYEARGINKMFDDYLGRSITSFNIKDVKAENIKEEDICVNPLILSCKIEDYADLHKNEDTLSFTIGNYIGKQDPAEQKEARMLPVERLYNVVYERTIKVDVPSGYKCLNFSDLNTEVYDTDFKPSAKAAFYVEAQQKGNQIVVDCGEYYKRNFYPASESEGVLKVAQAAAEFNKKKLIFIKK